MDLGYCDGDLLYLSASKRHKLNISLFWEIFFYLGRLVADLWALRSSASFRGSSF